jgi:hypothetical protein
MHTLPGKDQIRISTCIGKVPRKYITVSFKNNWPLFVVLVSSLLFHIGYFIFKFYLKHFGSGQLQKFEKFEKHVMPNKTANMYNFLATSLAMFLLVGGSFVAFKLTAMNPEEIDSFPNYILLHAYDLVNGTFTVLFFLIAYLSKNKTVRREVFREIADAFSFLQSFVNKQ